jgi:hypothetical protein
MAYLNIFGSNAYACEIYSTYFLTKNYKDKWNIDTYQETKKFIGIVVGKRNYW